MDLAKLVIATIVLGTLSALFVMYNTNTTTVELTQPVQEIRVVPPAPTVIIPHGFQAAYDSNNPNVTERAREVAREEISSSEKEVRIYVDSRVESVNNLTLTRISALEKAVQGVSNVVTTQVAQKPEVSAATKEAQKSIIVAAVAGIIALFSLAYAYSTYRKLRSLYDYCDHPDLCAEEQDTDATTPPATS